MKAFNKSEKDYYTNDFYIGLHNHARQSAEVIVPLILDLLHCSRIIDIGCGDGTWLKVFQEHGVEEIAGIDGNYIDENILVIPKEKFIPYDLRAPLKINEKFDLAMSLEVAEHLPEDCAELFINSLVALSSTVLFSAAIPHQGGANHINEQWQDYWVEKFKARGYTAIDYIRPKVWNNSEVAYWYRQNILLFINDSYLKSNYLLEEKLANYFGSTSFSAVHPSFYLLQIGAINWQDINKINLSSPNIHKLNRQGFLAKFKNIIRGFQKNN